MAHLPEKRDMTFRTGQDSMAVYFFRFSCSGKLFIFNYGYFYVSGFRFRKALYIKL